MTIDADDATTILTLAPETNDVSTDVSAQLLERVGDLDRVVAVTVTDSPHSWLDSWRAHGSDAQITCIDVDAETRAVAAAGSAPREHTDTTIEHVGSPANLERVGRTVSDVLQRADDGDEQVGLAVHSVTGLLQQVDESTAFKFVYTLGEVVRRVDGVACFTLDPDAHDDETVETFSIACDAVVELDQDLGIGELRTRER